jgi:hypothetical protein
MRELPHTATATHLLDRLESRLPEYKDARYSPCEEVGACIDTA